MKYKKYALILLGLLLLLPISPQVLFHLHRFVATQRLKAIQDEYRKQGIPLDAKELIPLAIPDSENPALLIKEAWLMYSPHQNTVDTWNSKISKMEPIPDSEAKALFSQPNIIKTLELLHQAAQKSKPVLDPSAFVDDETTRKKLMIEERQKLCDLLASHIQYQLQCGNIDGAYSGLEDYIALPKYVSVPSSHRHLNRAFDKRAAHFLWKICSTDSTSGNTSKTDQLDRISTLLQAHRSNFFKQLVYFLDVTRIDFQSTVADKIIRGEMDDSAVEKIFETMNPEYSKMQMLMLVIALAPGEPYSNAKITWKIRYLRFKRRVLTQYFRMPFSPLVISDYAELLEKNLSLRTTFLSTKEPKKLEAALESLRGCIFDPPYITNCFLHDLNITIFSSYIAEYLRLDYAIFGIALEKYRLQHGSYPTTLKEAGEKLGIPVPQDPFHPGGVIYRPSSTGLLIYSVGPDKQDNGGHEDNNDDPFYCKPKTNILLWKTDSSGKLLSPP